MSDGITDAYNNDRWRGPATETERLLDELDLVKRCGIDAIVKAAKKEALEAVLAMREAAYDECEYDESCIGVAIYVRMIEAEMAKL